MLKGYQANIIRNKIKIAKEKFNILIYTRREDGIYVKTEYYDKEGVFDYSVTEKMNSLEAEVVNCDMNSFSGARYRGFSQTPCDD